jgi:hypothetical protein
MPACSVGTEVVAFKTAVIHRDVCFGLCRKFGTGRLPSQLPPLNGSTQSEAVGQLTSAKGN